MTNLRREQEQQQVQSQQSQQIIRLYPYKNNYIKILQCPIPACDFSITKVG